MYSYNDMIDIVTAANMAGYMEHTGVISLSDDEELYLFIQKELNRYADSVDSVMENCADYNWHDWIDAALRKEYGTEETE